MYKIQELVRRQKLIKDSKFKARQATEKFVKKARFTSLVSFGIPPVEAARRMGIDVPVGERMTATEILQMIEEEYKET